jgi:hypothetical protein
VNGLYSLLVQKKDNLTRLESNYKQLATLLSYFDSNTSLAIIEENQKILEDLQNLDSQLATDKTYPLIQENLYSEPNSLSVDPKYVELCLSIDNIVKSCMFYHDRVTPLLQKVKDKQREELNLVSVQIQLKDHFRKSQP